jgi:hypothetical protein
VAENRPADFWQQFSRKPNDLFVVSGKNYGVLGSCLKVECIKVAVTILFRVFAKWPNFILFCFFNFPTILAINLGKSLQKWSES